jgi:hypothetical protein
MQLSPLLLVPLLRHSISAWRLQQLYQTNFRRQILPLDTQHEGTGNVLSFRLIAYALRQLRGPLYASIDLPREA